MGTFSKQQKFREELRYKEKVRIENLGKFVYDLAKLIFAAIVLGGILPLYSDVSNMENWMKVLSGFCFTIALSKYANYILKR
ncbi:DUF6722 family protein [Parabacteroides hominis]|jgi:hypothetical protein|uniref:Mechanosensitive ion channel protein MscS n=1 Tax=Parabacteroides hominis TaxID=2763057 RepID=A0ABR7DW01_9BACT|nr:DUF6722 family protein [Parabacteroides hominis]MBC5634898.1 hypothetical protein [Parabacteroides hominis]MBD9166498.1 hypothetical protein [Parabacteroides johnsonii]